MSLNKKIKINSINLIKNTHFDFIQCRTGAKDLQIKELSTMALDCYYNLIINKAENLSNLNYSEGCKEFRLNLFRWKTLLEYPFFAINNYIKDRTNFSYYENGILYLSKKTIDSMMKEDDSYIVNQICFFIPKNFKNN